MKRFIFFLSFIATGALSAQTMIVRVYGRWEDLTSISPKYNLDIATGRMNEWYDIVADYNTADRFLIQFYVPRKEVIWLP